MRLQYVALLPPALLAVKRRGGPVAQLWVLFAIFQLFRASIFSGKIWGSKLWRRGGEGGASDENVAAAAAQRELTVKVSSWYDSGRRL